MAFFEKIRRKSLGCAANVVECVILGDHTTPAVRSETDFVNHEKLLLKNK
jgi:hypothetical protein